MDPLVFKLARAAALAARPLQEQVAKAHRLTLAQWRVLALLEAEPGLSVTQVAQTLGLDKMAASRAADGLSQQRRLQRHDDPTDQRRSRLFLTAAGRTLAATLASAGQAQQARLLAGWSAQDLSRLDAALDRLIAAAQPA